MTSQVNPQVLSADKPLHDPLLDRLGYAPFAEHLASGILKLAPAEGFVLAVQGPWGSGKSTVLNFLSVSLAQLAPGEECLVTRFNPWWFSGREDLAQRFFTQILITLGHGDSKTKKLAGSLADFAELVSETPIPYAQAAKASAGFINKHIRKSKDLDAVKEKLSKALLSERRRIVVVIDDIDRLTPLETSEMFRVVKAVADFPNIVYVLAFDKNVVVTSLTAAHGTPGQAFLEKIVQLPVELPLPEKLSLRRILFERVETLLGDLPEERLDRVHWGNLYFDGIDPWIHTPRDIVRLTNSLALTYPVVEFEVNPADFIAVTALYVFHPTVYDLVRDNPDHFTGQDTTGLHGPRIDELRIFHDAWLSEVEDKDQAHVKRLLTLLFPKLNIVWGNTGYGSEWLSIWRQKLHVCSPERFPIYFRFTVSTGEVSNIEMESLLAMANDAAAFGARLLQFSRELRPDGTTRLRVALERLEDYTSSQIPTENIGPILKTLSDIGDRLLVTEDEPSGLLDFGNDMRISRLFYQLLMRLPEGDRITTFKDAISESHSLFIVVDQVDMLEPMRAAKNGIREPHVTEGQFEELKDIALNFIRRAAAESTLIEAPNLPSILFRWQAWAGEEEAKEWTTGLVQTEDGLGKFLSQFRSKTLSRGLSDSVGTSTEHLRLQNIESFVDPTSIVERAKRMSELPELPDEFKLAANLFLQNYDDWLSGKNTDGDFAE